MVALVASVHVIGLAMLCCAWRAAGEQCEVRVRTQAGWVCSNSAPGGKYASFLAVPYAKQPLGQLRFQELQPPEPWDGCRDATKRGPVCPQRDLFYGPTLQTSDMSEECIHANIHVPLSQLTSESPPLLPVLVHIHGGGFAFGSGEPDLHGPEYLMQDGNVIVITFNYRIGPFGFLSLNSTSIPGNAGLRDMVTLLRWVKLNVEAFGGDPGDVTLSGQSAGAAAAHLLSLSKAAEGLFKRVILMSGASIRSFMTTSPVYAQFIADLFLKQLGISGADPEEAHRQLVALPLEKILEANNFLQDYTGLIVFTPVVESAHPGVETILDDYPETLQAKGRGKDLPFMIGFTNAECENFRPRFEEINMMERIKNLPLLVLPPPLIYSTPQEEYLNKITQTTQKYFGVTPNMDKFLKICSDAYFEYPALKLAEIKAAIGGAPVYLYEFAYKSDYGALREALNLKYSGAGHSDDLFFVFRASKTLAGKTLTPSDEEITRDMTTYVTDFMRFSNPTDSELNWSPVKKDDLHYLNIVAPKRRIMTKLSREQQEMMRFFDNLYGGSDS